MRATASLAVSGRAVELPIPTRGAIACPSESRDSAKGSHLPWVSQLSGRALATAPHTRATFYSLVSATKKSAAAQAVKSRGRNWKIPCVLPGSSRPPTKGGASAEVSVTQSCGDEIPGSTAKQMACSLRSCRLRTLRRGTETCLWNSRAHGDLSVLTALLQHTAGSYCLHRTLAAASQNVHTECAEGWSWDRSW